MSKRRVFLKVVGVGAAVLPVACGDDDSGETGAGGNGAGGQGGAGVTSSASSASSSASTSSAGGGLPDSFELVGLVQDFEVGKLGAVMGKSLIIGWDDDGFYAMSSLCTHNNCDMLDKGELTDTGVSCDCHGSIFDINGDVVVGPADRVLKHYLVEVTDNNRVYVDMSMEVDPMFRAPTP